MPDQGKCFSVGYVTLSGPVTADKESFVAAMSNSVREKG